MVISQPQTYLDDQPSVWLPRLIDWASQGEQHFRDCAVEQRRHGYRRNALGYDALADNWSLIAGRAQRRLRAITEPPQHVHTPGLSELMNEQEPPSTLVPFVGWLVDRLGRWLPFVRAETWQTLGMLILRDRERSQGRLP